MLPPPVCVKPWRVGVAIPWRSERGIHFPLGTDRSQPVEEQVVGRHLTRRARRHRVEGPDTRDMGHVHLGPTTDARNGPDRGFFGDLRSRLGMAFEVPPFYFCEFSRILCVDNDEFPLRF